MTDLSRKLGLEQLSPESLRFVRAVETLEYIGDAKAKELLAKLAQGDPASRLTQEAQATSIRLDRRESMKSADGN